MTKASQLAILIIGLGGVINLIGLFPTITGLEPTPGIGILQILTILVGFSVLIAGAILFVNFTYYSGTKQNLAPQISIRLSLTGFVIVFASGFADVLGYGSNPPGPTQRPIFGPLQTIGLLAGFIIASFGVISFALLGDSGKKS